MAAPTTPLLPLRALVFLGVAAVSGTTAALLGYWDSHSLAAAILAGLLTAGSTLMWVLAVDWSMLPSVRGAVILVFAFMIGAVIGVLSGMVLHTLAAAIFCGTSAFGGSLTGLQKIVY